MTDQLERVAAGYRVRIRYGKGQRQRYTMPLRSAVEAETRAATLRELAAMLTKAGRSAQAPVVLKKAAEATTQAVVDEVVAFTRELCSEPTRAPRAARKALTVRQLGEAWTTGKLAEQYPDQIKAKRSAADDRIRLERHIYPLLQHKPVASITLEDCEAVMAHLPPSLAPKTRRNVGQLLTRLLKLSVYPLRIIDRSPIPEGFLPRPQDSRAKAFLYPDEDRRLLAHRKIPLCYRLLWGFLTREGMRAGEAVTLAVGDLDLKRGAVRLDQYKTDDPRTWALSPGVARSLAVYLETYRPGAKASELVFTDEHGRQLERHTLAAVLREHLEQVGLKQERPELFTTTATRLRIRVHDLRGTFVTVSLANGKTESWISDRTGHRSSEMIARYKRTARTFQELELGDLVPLDEALPELSATGSGQGKGRGSKAGPKRPKPKTRGIRK